MLNYKKSFIAVDLETTHLSSEEGKIIEVGAVEARLIFIESEKRIKVEFGAEFQTLVNPEIDVPPEPLHLTGISLDDLNQAPRWKDIKPSAIDFFGSHRLLGHNIGFDLGFLESQGVGLKNNPFVDSLEVAQVLTPLQLSHSLEYLAESFGVDHKESHRALYDAKATALVLAEILNQFFTLPKPFQQEVKSYMQKGRLGFGDLFFDLPEIHFPAPKIVTKRHKEPNLLALPIDFEDKALYQVPVSFNRIQEWTGRLAKFSQNLWVSVPSPFFLDEVAAKHRVINPKWALCEKRFKQLLKLEDFSPALARMIIKIRILQTLRGHPDLSDLRWGAEEYPLLSNVQTNPEICLRHNCNYVSALRNSARQTIFSDHKTLFAIYRNWKVGPLERALLMVDLADVEDAFTQSLIETWNLGKIRAELGRVYPIEGATLSRYNRVPEEAARFADELDLFFGILHLVYLQKDREFSQNLLITEQEREQDRFAKLSRPAEKLAEKLKNFAGYLEDHEALEADIETRQDLQILRKTITALASFLLDFFIHWSDENIYWLNFNSDWVDLSRIPRFPSGHWTDMANSFAKISFIDTDLPKLSLDYFKNRLGLNQFVYKPVEGLEKERFTVFISGRGLEFNATLKLVENLNGSSIFVLPNETQLERYWDHFSTNPLSDTEILAYKFSGSLSRLKIAMSRIASQTPKRRYILLLTTHALRHSFDRLPPAENMIIQKLPFEAPGARPEVSSMTAGGADFFATTLPRVIYLLHRFLTKFAKSKPKDRVLRRKIYLLDERVMRNYQMEIKKYLEQLDDFEIQSL